jgi:hypothetical protein
MMNSGRLIRAIVYVLLVGMGLVASAQMPAPPQMPAIPDAPPIPSAPPPMSPGPSMPPGSQPDGSQTDGSQTNRSQTDRSQTDRAQANGAQSGGFLGAWCAQGDPMKHASISNNGVFLNLTNENGDTSVGNLQGANQVVAPGWQFVTGTLSRDGSQINWSNGTFWARCRNSGGGGRRSPNLNGNWYPNGNRSLSCSIQQRRGNLTLQNETGQRATGSFNGRDRVSTNWSGTRISGMVSSDGNRIDWDNGTYWIRYRVYSN